MPRQNALIHKFNRGIISTLAFARVDLDRLAMAAETMTNWIARVFGSMMLRPGTAYLGRTFDNIGSITERTNPKNVDLNSVAYGNSIYVAVGDPDGTDAYIVTSTDGITWTERSNPKNFILFDVVYGGGLFVAVGYSDGTDAYIVTSADGITWTERSNPKNVILYSVTYGNSTFVAVGGYDGSDVYILTSSDGITWTERSNSLSVSTALFSVTYGGSQFVAVGNGSSDACVGTSPDGITWTERSTNRTTALYSVVYADSIYVAVGAADGTDAYILTSDDAITWTERSNPKNFALTNVIHTDNVFLAVGAADGTDAYLIYSVNGVDWTELSNDKNFNLNGAIWNNNIFIAVGNADGTDAYLLTGMDTNNKCNMLEFIFSTDDVALVEITDSNMRVWVDDALVTRPTTTSAVNNNLFSSSVDTFELKERTNPKNASLLDVTFGNNLFVAVGTSDGVDTYIVTSAQGSDWTERTAPSTSSLAGVTYGNNIYVAVGFLTGSDAYILTSPDSITWTERSNPKDFSLREVVYGNSLFVAVGDPDGTDAYIVTSADGITWTERSNPKNFRLSSVSWSGSLFVAVGVADGTDAYIVTSTDGITWTERSNPKNFALDGVTYGNGIFVAVGAVDGTDAYIVTSTDGITWTERSNPNNIQLYEVVYGGGLFVAVGELDGTDSYIITSTDGITWTERTNPKNKASYAITYGNGTFVTVGIEDGTDSYILTATQDWVDADESGGTSAWVTGGYLGLTGNGTNYAIRRQLVIVPTADQGVEHALRIVIQRGPVLLRVGSTSGGDEYINETTLGTGTHSLTLTPTGNFYIEFKSLHKRQVLVDSCTIEGDGVMTVSAPWAEADLDKIRFDQSGDVLYVACEGYQQHKIERRSETSWSLVKYEPEDGPFGLINTSPITITPSALSGNVTLTASKNLFRSGHVGALYRIASTGQEVTTDVTAENQFTNTILVEGTGTNRVFTVTRSGTWSATVTLQRSLVSEDGPWQDVTTYTTNASVAYNDALDNQIAWYRIGVKTGDYTSGTATLTLSYAIGTIEGVARVTAYTSATSVSAEVITDFGGTDASEDWYEGEWSSVKGYPTSVSFVEGRLGWAGKNGVWLSVSDAFESFDDLTTGDSGPISRTIGSGPVDTINWMLALQRLILGAEGAEFVCKSSSLDEPLTPTNFNVKPASTQGSAEVEAVIIDKMGVYIQRGGTRVMEVAYDSNDGEYGSKDLTVLCPEVTSPQVKRMAIQRQPDTRIHCVLNDGTVAIAIFDRAENVLCWQLFETDGDVEDVSILPGVAGQSEDQVYYVVKRTINSATKRYLEKWALESECVGGSLNKQADSFLSVSQASSTTISGLSHLEGESVVVWANSKDLGSYTVSSGAITVSEAVTTAIVGLTYTAQWKSTKLAYAAGLGTALLQKKNISHLGLLLKNTHYQGIDYGLDFTTMYDLPLVENGTEVAADTVHSNYDEEAFTFPGTWDTDNRLCLQATAPRPATVLAAVLTVEGTDKS